MGKSNGKDEMLDIVTGLNKDKADEVAKDVARKITRAGSGRTHYVKVENGNGGWRVSLWKRGKR